MTDLMSTCAIASGMKGLADLVELFSTQTIDSPALRLAFGLTQDPRSISDVGSTDVNLL
jgi:hypothetical protein